METFNDLKNLVKKLGQKKIADALGLSRQSFEYKIKTNDVAVVTGIKFYMLEYITDLAIEYEKTAWHSKAFEKRNLKEKPPKPEKIPLPKGYRKRKRKKKFL